MYLNKDVKREENPGETNEKVRLIPTHLERQVMGGGNKELDKTSTEVVLGEHINWEVLVDSDWSQTHANDFDTPTRVKKNTQ